MEEFTEAGLIKRTLQGFYYVTDVTGERIEVSIFDASDECISNASFAFLDQKEPFEFALCRAMRFGDFELNALSRSVPNYHI